jgi:predicted transcriptional regulator
MPKIVDNSLVSTSFLLPAAHKARMAAIAKQEDRRPSEIYRRAVAGYLAQLDLAEGGTAPDGPRR